MTQALSVVTFDDYQNDPVATFKTLLSRLTPQPFIPMNLATLDSEFGILNRTIVYRGFIEDGKTDAGLVFVTERNTQKYKNLMENRKVGVTFFFTDVAGLNGEVEFWQVRLIDAEAFELSDSEIAKYWAEEALYSKIRSHLCECGKPTDHAEFKRRHEQLVKDYNQGKHKLEQTKTFTAFKILAKRWDFYKTMPDCIADRVQYRKQSYNLNEAWNIMHVEP